MKILLDANLSWRLIKKLQPFFEEIIHVNDLKLHQPLSDIEIWNFAKENQFIIITKDDDFEKLVLLRKAPPKVIYLKIFNSDTNKISTLLFSNIDKIQKFAASKDDEILEMYSS